MRSPKRCKWGGDPCSALGGEGPYQNFCAAHAARLAAVDITAPVRASARAREEKARRTPEGESKPPDPLGRLPIRQRAATLARYVRAASHPVSQIEAARALDLASTTGSLPRIIRCARDLGWIAERFGRGYLPGSVPPPAEPVEAPEAA